MNAEINQERLQEVLTKPIARGAHGDESAMCVMEAVAFVAGENRVRVLTAVAYMSDLVGYRKSKGMNQAGLARFLKKKRRAA